MVVYDDLTLESALSDPMIALVRRAYRVDRQSFTVLLRSAAQARAGVRPAPTDDARVSAAVAATVHKKHCGSACAW